MIERALDLARGLRQRAKHLTWNSRYQSNREVMSIQPCATPNHFCASGGMQVTIESSPRYQISFIINDYAQFGLLTDQLA